MGIESQSRSISIVVPISRNTKRSNLLTLLESVEHQSLSPAEVLIVSDSPFILKSENKSFKILVQSSMGASSARNYGAKHSSSDLLGFLDDDVVLDNYWCEAAVETFADRTIGAVSGLAKVGCNEEMLEWVPHSLRWVFGGTYWSYTRTHDVYGAAGMNFCVRKDVFLHAGGYSARLGPRGDRPEISNWKRLGAEESELALRIILGMEKRVVYNPRMIVIHKVSPRDLTPAAMVKRALHIGHNRALIANLFPQPVGRFSDINVATGVIKSLLPTSPQRLNPWTLWKRLSFTSLILSSVMIGYLAGRIDLHHLDWHESQNASKRN